jgi:hypothetical protein
MRLGIPKKRGYLAQQLERLRAIGDRPANPGPLILFNAAGRR